MSTTQVPLPDSTWLWTVSHGLCLEITEAEPITLLSATHTHGGLVCLSQTVLRLCSEQPKNLNLAFLAQFHHFHSDITFSWGEKQSEKRGGLSNWCLWSPCDWCSKNSVFHVFSQTWRVRIVKTFKQSMLYNVIKYYIATHIFLVLTTCVQTQYTTPSMFCQRDLSLPCSHIDLYHLKEYCSICCTRLLLNSTLMLFPHWCSSPTQDISFYHTAWWEWDRCPANRHSG